MNDERTFTYDNAMSELAVLRERVEAYRSNEQMFHALVETAVGSIGEEFFRKIVVKLSEWLNAECIIVGQLVGENVVQGFPMYLDGEIVEGFSYTLEGTPCDLTSRKGYCEYRDHVRDFFPTSKDLIDLNARGYVGTALYNKDGVPNGVLCAISRNELKLPPQAEDILRIVGARITVEIERMKALRALEQSERELRQANATKDKLFSIIAHDLRNPFLSLIGFSELLLEDIRDGDHESCSLYAERIHESATRTYELLDNLLEWSHSQTGGLTYQPEMVNVPQLCARLLPQLELQRSRKSVRIHQMLEDGLEIHADRHMLELVLRNLLTNAIKYSHPGGDITLAALRENGNVSISVTDNGVGIAEHRRATLFDPANSSTEGTMQEVGSGLGLLLCREFMQRHGGNIAVESTAGEGSTFTITLPV